MKRKNLTTAAALGLIIFAGAAQAQWTPAQRLTWTLGESYGPKIAAGPLGNIQVVWEEGTSEYCAVFHKKSLDGGATWAGGKRITWEVTLFRYPDLAVDSSGNPHVVWYEDAYGHNEIFYKKSADGGTAWTAIKRLSSGISWSRYPDISVDSSGNPHVVWPDAMPGNWEVYYRKSTDGGTAWAALQKLTWNSGESEDPDMAIDPSGDFHLVWADTMPGNGEIYYKKSTDGGATWSISRRLTQTWGGSADPEICADSSGNLHLVWADSTPGNSEIYYLRSTDGGTTWGSAKRLTWTSGLSGIPNIAVDPSGNPHVVWHDDTSGNKEIIYRKSPDGGGAWTAAQRLTWTMDDSGWPDIAADSSGNLHVVWGESMPANAEIYYRRFND